jgi:aspartate/methionine/tyrosine aminotransferase
MSLLAALRAEARNTPESGIVRVANYGRTKPGLIPLWAGEGDEPTPAFINEAVTRSLAAGETFYTYQRGIPDLRDALARYHARVFGRAFSAHEFFVTGSGMQAIQIAFAAIAGAGDEVIVPSPLWPNAAGAIGVMGATPVFVPMTFGNAGWTLDLERLFAARTERTRAIFVNSPANPTGWTATRDELVAILAFARAHGLWIVADEIYARFYWGEDAERAPSFFDVMEPEDRILFVNTMSKNWSMTGWRVGWIVANPALGQVMENLVQYSTSGTPVFLQRGAIAALDRGEDYARHVIERARQGRDIVCDALGPTGRARFVKPMGAFYLFFAIDGESHVIDLGLRLVDEANVGLAPGTAFGPAGAGFMRLCFLRSPEQLREATNRLTSWMVC